MPDTRVLDTIKSVYDTTNPTVRDFMPYNSTGEDFFPGKNQSINAGSYSGSEVGSIPIYAPQGELVPFAAYGARDRVIEKAAQEKMKDLMNYQKSINPPETKLQGVNPALHDAYYNMLEQEQNRMKKQYGRDWVKYANQDIEFQRKNQAYKDLATYHDQFVDQYANDDQEMKLGKFVPTEQYLETRKKILSATNFINDPNNPLVKELPENFLKFKLEREFSGAANEFIKEQVKQKLNSLGVDESNPDYFRIAKTEEESYTPDQLKQTAQAMKYQWYRTSDYWTKDRIAENLKAMYGNKQVTGATSIQQKRDDGTGGVEMFDEAQAAKEPTVFNVNMEGENAGAGDPVFSEVTGSYGVTYATPPKGQLPVGQQVFLMDNTEGKGGMVPSKVIGVKNAVYGKSFIGEVLNAPGTKYDGWPVTEAMRNGELTDKDGNKIPYNPKATRMESLTVGQYTEGTGDDKVVASFVIPTEYIANVLTKKKMGSGKNSMGVAEYQKQKAGEMNKGRMSAAAPADKKTSVPGNAELRRTKDGRNAYFDKTTKKFISWQ